MVSTLYSQPNFPSVYSQSSWNIPDILNFAHKTSDSNATERRIPQSSALSPPHLSTPTDCADETQIPTNVSCRVCDKKFQSTHRLQRHMMSHNESDNLRRFKCDECAKAFKFKHHLKEHKRIHSGEKPFACANCGKRFSHSGSYSSHMSSKKCQLGRSRNASATYTSRASSHFNNKRNILSSSNFMAVLPKTTSPIPSDLGYSSPPGAADNILLSPPSLVSPNTNPACHSSTFPGLHPNLMQSSLPHYSLQYDLRSLLLAAHMRQQQFTFLPVVPDKDSSVFSSKNETKEQDDDEPGKLIITDSNAEEEEPTPTQEAPKFSIQDVLSSVNSSLTKAKFDEAISHAATPMFEHNSMNALKCSMCGYMSSSFAESFQHRNASCPKLEELNNMRNSLSGHLIEGIAAQFRAKSSPVDMESAVIKTEDADEKVVIDHETLSDGKKVRVRTNIREEQLRLLRQYFVSNQRPKKEELSAIAQSVSLSNRVVQVWFQNARARDRREGKCSTPNSAPSTLPASPSPSRNHSPAISTPPPKNILSSYYPLMMTTNDSFSAVEPSDMPLDLSMKRPDSSASRNSDDSFEGRTSSHEDSDSQSKLAQILNGKFSNLSYSSDSFSEKRPREDDSCIEDSRKRRKDDESGIYQCDECDKSFNKQSSLTRHKYEHSGLRPYQCQMCVKAFKHKHHLTEHNRLHTGEKPYQCNNCQKRFSHSGSFSQHINHRSSYCRPQGDVSTPLSSPDGVPMSENSSSPRSDPPKCEELDMCISSSSGRGSLSPEEDSRDSPQLTMDLTERKDDPVST